MATIPQMFDGPEDHHGYIWMTPQMIEITPVKYMRWQELDAEMDKMIAGWEQEDLTRSEIDKYYEAGFEDGYTEGQYDPISPGA